MSLVCIRSSTGRVARGVLAGLLGLAGVIGLIGGSGAQAQSAGVHQLRLLTPETALSAARSALESCRKQGYQVSVAVVDRFGLVQVQLRDRFAGPHTLEVSANKAWTAVSFRSSTEELAASTQAGKPMSGLRGLSRFMAAGGGVVIEGGGHVYGAIGVSGGPGGEADEGCARAGIQAIADAIEF